MLEGEILNGKYKVEKILGRGGMSCVYLCTNLELGKLWAVKHVYKQKDNANILLAEVEILKKLNHLSLPQIVDVFSDQSGTYIVESYIEGISLESELQGAGYFNESIVIEWAKQLCGVLIYLHNLKPHPIIYRDMKPSNIIVTRDNRLVIVDFGISRVHKSNDTKDTLIAGTSGYAAPEQLIAHGYTDQRTDIYSLGVTLYHLLTGKIPDYEAKSLRSYRPEISREMDIIVLKCIQKNLEDRYQTAEELKTDLDNIETYIAQNRRESKAVKIVAVSIIVLSIISYMVSFLGLKEASNNKMVILEANPKMLVLSEQQVGQIIVEKVDKNGSRNGLNNDSIQWSVSDDKVAKVENGRVTAMNKGKIIVTGRFQGKTFKLDVNVDAKQKDYININLRYNKEYLVETFAGNGERDVKDGQLSSAGLFEPSSITMSSGAIYFIDNYLRKIENGRVKTMSVSPGYIEPKIVRSDRNDRIYIASREWIDGNEQCKIGLYKLEGEMLQPVYEDNGELYSFIDFALDGEGRIWALQEAFISGTCRLIRVSPHSKSIELLKDKLDSIDSITIGANQQVYMSSAKYGTIYRWVSDKKDIEYIAGLYNQKHFVDGKVSRFFEPGRVYAEGNNLYVIDKDIVRKISIINSKVEDVETIAGCVAAGALEADGGSGADAVFGAGRGKDIVVDRVGNIFITDTANNVIKRIYMRQNPEFRIQGSGVKS